MTASLAIITYNSSKYVLDTLNSAFRQTYQDIELIVSDDCSTDNTFQICRQWCEHHGERFVRIVCTQTLHNGGICWNYNHALKYTKGDWVKFIAGDDILHDDSIERYLNNTITGKALYFAGVKHLYEGSGIRESTLPKISDGSAKKQLSEVIRFAYGVEGSSLFASSNKLSRIGGFDMRFPLTEDLAIAMKSMCDGLPLGLLKETLVTWRVHSTSVSHNGSKENVAHNHQLNEAKHYYQTRISEILKRPLHYYHHAVDYYIVTHYSKGGFHRLLGYSLRASDIIFWIRKFHPITSVDIVFTDN